MRNRLFLMTAAVTALLLTGCGDMSKEKLLKEMQKATEGKEISSLTMNMDFDMNLSTQGISMDMGMNMDMDAKIHNEAKEVYCSINLGTDVLGETSNDSMEVYLIPEGEDYVSYVYTESTQTWEKQSYGDLLSIMENSNSETSPFRLFTDMDAKSITLAENTEELNGTEVYVLTCTISGDELQEIYDSSNALEMIEESLKENNLEDNEDMDDFTDLFDFDFTSVNLPVTLYVDAKTYLPVQMDMDIKGMEELMDSLIHEIILLTGEEIDLDITIDNLQVTCKDLGYEPVELPELPEEAKRSTETIDDETSFEQEMNEFIASGETCTIFKGDTSLTLTPPTGWHVVEWNEDTLVMYDKDDYSMYLTYYVFDDVSAEDLTAYSEDMLDQYKDYGYYVKHGSGDATLPVDCLWVSCIDDSITYFAWKPIGNNGYVFIQMDDYTGQDISSAVQQMLESL